MKKSQSPVWVVHDGRGWTHCRVDISLLADPRLGAYELGVYLGLAAHAECSTGDAHPSKSTLAGYLRASERKVFDAIRVLQAAGYIEVVPRIGESSIFKLLPPPLVAGSTAARAGPRTPAPPAGVHRGDPGTTCQTTPARGADELEPLNEREEEEADEAEIERYCAAHGLDPADAVDDEPDVSPLPALADQLVGQIAERALELRIAEKPTDPVRLPGRWRARAEGRIHRSERMRLAAQAVNHPALGCAGRNDADALQLEALVHVHRNQGAWPTVPPARRRIVPVDTPPELARDESATPMPASVRAALKSVR